MDRRELFDKIRGLVQSGENVSSDLIGFTPFGGPVAMRSADLAVCAQCGAVVPTAAPAKHIEWHLAEAEAATRWVVVEEPRQLAPEMGPTPRPPAKGEPS